MKRTIICRKAIIVTAASVFLAVCGGDDPSTPPPTASVSGAVRTATGAAIQGASVTVGSATATTGANGHFLLPNLPVGSATITTEAPGFDPKSEAVTLGAGANTHDVVLMPQLASVSGVVLAANGAVIAGATVRVRSTTTTTGADGRFQVDDLALGNALIVASAAGFDSLSNIVALTAGANTHDVVLTPYPIAALSGVVTATDGAVIEGASVKVGNESTTTGTDGRFDLHNLRAGNATVTIMATRYDQRVESVSLSEGDNVHDVVLTPQTLFVHQNLVAYLPQGVAEYKAAIVFLPGLRDPVTLLDLDSRALVKGTSELFCSIWCSAAQRTEVRSRALELAGGEVALIGTTTLVDNAASYQTLLQALSAFAAQSLHDELANIPIFFVGHSMGGCTAYGFTREHGARVAGFLTMKGACHNTGPALTAADVPGYFLIGAIDEPYRAENITAVFEGGRGAGAPWALSIDPYDHRPIEDFDLAFDWIDTVLAARLPLNAGEPLRAVTQTAGWLGNRSTGAIATYACYSAAPLSASWLPSQETALNWQRMAEGSVVVSECSTEEGL